MAEPRRSAVPRGLMQRLLDALKKPRVEKLQPPGHRSGRGTTSIQRYLEEARKSRPAPLDD